MLKMSACRNRDSSIHVFSSTTMRCIMAIWAAGPPKLMHPILSQTLKNSPKLEVSAPTQVRVVSLVFIQATLLAAVLRHSDHRVRAVKCKQLAKCISFPVREEAVLGLCEP